MTIATRKERAARLEAIRQQTREIVLDGTCPNCGSGLRRNLALTGWWQCEQFGTEQFRARPEDAQCSWQGFTQ